MLSFDFENGLFYYYSGDFDDSGLFKLEQDNVYILSGQVFNKTALRLYKENQDDIIIFTINNKEYRLYKIDTIITTITK